MEEGNKKSGVSLAVGHADLDRGEGGAAADYATLAPPEAQPDVRIEILGLIAAAAEPITEVATVLKVAERESSRRAAAKLLGGVFDLSPSGIRSC